MWHILRADPGAQIAIGFREPITKDRLRESSLSGEIEHLLRWVDVSPGETYFIPAGTVHAIGAGIALCEIQQHSDVTYRLYDYGRPRELHLDKALQVADTSAHDGRPVPLPIDCAYFHTDLLLMDQPNRLCARSKAL
jgi:mannose-6-phosphate isomerase